MTNRRLDPRERPGSTDVLARGDGIAVWRQIAEQIAGEIRARRYAESGRLPSENELAQRFGVNRHTLRQALAALQSQGLLRIEQGRGAFIRKDWLDYTLSRRTRYTENILGNRLAPGRQMLATRSEAASEKVAGALQMPKGARVLRAEHLDEADGQPVAVATGWFPAARFDGLLERLAAGAGISEALAALGVEDYFRATNRIVTQLPDEATARLLRQPRTQPVLCVEAVDVDAAGVPIKFGETVFSGERVQLVCETLPA